MYNLFRMHSVTALLVPLFFSIAGVAHAATYTVSPMVLDLTIAKRDIIQQEIVVTNVGETHQSIFPTVNTITVGEGGGINEFVTPSMSDRTATFSSWIEVSRTPFLLAPGEVRKIPLTIHVNPDADEGVYHAIVSFPLGANRDEAELLVKRGGVPGVMINATLTEKKVETLKLSHFFVKTFLTEPTPEAITIDVVNTGDVDIAPKGDVIIYNRKGEEVASVPINLVGEIIKAGGEARYTASVPIEQLVGKYKAYLSLSYGTLDDEHLQDTVFFFVAPWKKLLIVFGIIAVLTTVLSLLLYLRHRKRKMDDFDDADYNDDDDGSEYLSLHYKETVSEPVHHDIDMKKKT